MIYAFGSAELKYSVCIKAGLQPFFPAELGGMTWLIRSKLSQPFRIGSDAVLHTYDEVNSLNLIRLGWSTAYELGLKIRLSKNAWRRKCGVIWNQPGAHMPLYRKKVVTNAMTVKAVHALSLFKLDWKFVEKVCREKKETLPQFTYCKILG